MLVLSEKLQVVALSFMLCVTHCLMIAMLFTKRLTETLGPDTKMKIPIMTKDVGKHVPSVRAFDFTGISFCGN